MTALPVAVTVRGYIVASVLVLLVAGAVYLVRRYWPWRAPPAPPETRPEIDEPPAERHVRSPSDVLRLIVGVLLVLIGLLFAGGASNTLVGFERDLISAFDALPEVVARAINLGFQGFASIVFTAILVVALWRRRYRLFVMLVAASLVAQLLLAALDQGIVQQFGEPELLRAIHRPDWVGSPGRDRLELGRQQRRRRHPGLALGESRVAARRLDHRGPRPGLPRRGRRRRADRPRPGLRLRRRKRRGRAPRLRGAQQAPARAGGRRRHGASRSAPEAARARRRGRAQLHPLLRRGRGRALAVHQGAGP